MSLNTKAKNSVLKALTYVQQSSGNPSHYTTPLPSLTTYGTHPIPKP